MAKTLLTTRTMVRSFLDEASATDWSDAEINLLINNYYHRVRSFAVTTYEDYYMTTATLNSVAAQEEYTSASGLPTNILKIRRVELNYDVTSTTGAPTRCLPIENFDMIRRDLGYANAGVGVMTYGTASYYTYGFGSNFTLGFIPKPSNPGGSGTNAIKIWYIREAPDLSSDTDTLDLPYADKNYMIVVYGAVSEGLRFGSQDVATADVFEQKYVKEVSLMQEELADKIAEESKLVMDTTNENISFDAP